MKIVVNYDLMEEIIQAKYGFSLVRTTKKILPLFGYFYGIPLAIFSQILDPLAFQEVVNDLPIGIFIYFAITIPGSALVQKKLGGKELSLKHLVRLAAYLKSLDIDTDCQLLLDSYKYHTEYELDWENKTIPSLVKKDYISIPTLDKRKNVSVLQEHTVGSETYTLSKGYPVKKTSLKLATSKI